MLKACTQTLDSSKLKIEENGKKAIIANKERRSLSKIRFDGCVVQNEEACDYIVADPKIGYVLIELKGKDVEKALKQIHSSVQFISTKELFSGKFGALIICGGVKKTPKFTTLHQRIKNEFAKKHSAPIHIINGSYEYTIEKLISFGNPLSAD